MSMAKKALVRHLLYCMGEEAGEVSQMAGKMGRFGCADVYPEGGLPNLVKLVWEINDILAIGEMLQEAGVPLKGVGDRNAIDSKKERVRKWIRYADQQGVYD